MEGVFQPANSTKSAKLGVLSQWGYQSGIQKEAWEQQVQLLKMLPHMQREAQIPTGLPRAFTAAMRSMVNWQFSRGVWSAQEQPGEGLVSISIQMVRQRVAGRLSMSSLTWAVGFLPRQGNMQVSVCRPAVCMLVRLCTAWVSMPPKEQYPRAMAKVMPLVLAQVQFQTEKSWETSMPRVEVERAVRRERRRGRIRLGISNKQWTTINVQIDYCWRLYF